MNNFKDFDIKFQRILDEKGYTQRSFAKKINKSSPYINSLCVGKRKPTAKTVKEIADALGVPAEYFLDESVSNSVVGNAAGRDMRIQNGPVASPGCADKLEILSLKLDIMIDILRQIKDKKQ